ncbi:MAG: hypothetical protein ACREGB_03245 [Candidatus Saccharimonadales bacterium]
MSKQLSVAIIYGLAEGRYHSRKLRRALVSVGYQVTPAAQSADIIIAHSAGCYLVPAEHRAQLVLNIGYTYWPARSLLRSLHVKLTEERRHVGIPIWLYNCLIHTLYMCNIVHTWRLAQAWSTRRQYLADLQWPEAFVRNRDDPYCQAESLLQITHQQHRYVSLPGYHDHLWNEPDVYVNLLQSVI